MWEVPLSYWEVGLECLRYGCRNNSLLALTSAPIADAAGLFSSKSKRTLETSIYRGFGCLKALLPASASVAVNITSWDRFM